LLDSHGRGVFSATDEMRDGALVEVATVGREGMLGIGVFLGDRTGAGRTTRWPVARRQSRRMMDA
jgi:hypothetical protein